MVGMVALTGKRLNATKDATMRRPWQREIGGLISALREELEHPVTVSRRSALHRVSTRATVLQDRVTVLVPCASLVDLVVSDARRLVVLARLEAEAALLVSAAEVDAVKKANHNIEKGKSI